MPVMIQAISRPPAEPVWRAMSAETMKMPEPIIEPTTIMVESNRLRPRTNPASVTGGDGVAATSDIFSSPDCRGFFQVSGDLRGRIGTMHEVAYDGERIGAGAPGVG